MKKIWKKFTLILVIIIILLGIFFRDMIVSKVSKLIEQTADKPVIYLYPKEEMDVSVKLDLEGKLKCTYPKYEKAWKVKAYSDGRLINENDGKEYYYLFWEGELNKKFEMDKGFVVKGDKTVEFLEEKLEYLGLNSKERNDFISFWLPKLEINNYNLITFNTKEYEEVAELDISPKPDSIIRVFMTYKPLEKKITIPEQELKKGIRGGFTVVEWGGGEVK